MTQILNQFGQAPVQGQLDLQSQSGSTISCQISSTQVAALVPGQSVKLDTSVPGGIPKVISLAANSDIPFGFVAYTVKDQNFPALARVEIAMSGKVMYMTSGAAITRGAKVEIVNSTTKVITNAGTNPVAGFALDGATATDQLIRVWILTQSLQSAQVIADVAGLQTALDARALVKQIVVTQAQLNAGQALIAGVTGKKITVLGIQAKYAGTFAVGTAMVIQSDNGTPVVVVTETLAGMAAGNQPIPYAADANQTLGAGWGVPLGTGDGLQVVKTGSSFTGGTSVTLAITYQQI